MPFTTFRKVRCIACSNGVVVKLTDENFEDEFGHTTCPSCDGAGFLTYCFCSKEGPGYLGEKDCLVCRGSGIRPYCIAVPRALGQCLRSSKHSGPCLVMDKSDGNAYKFESANVKYPLDRFPEEEWPRDLVISLGTFDRAYGRRAAIANTKRKNS